MPLEILHVAFVLLRRLLAGESAEIAPPAGARIFLARVEPVLAGLEFADHWTLPSSGLIHEAASRFLTSRTEGRYHSGAVGNKAARGNNRNAARHNRCRSSRARCAWVAAARRCLPRYRSNPYRAAPSACRRPQRSAEH